MLNHLLIATLMASAPLAGAGAGPIFIRDRDDDAPPTGARRVEHENLSDLSRADLHMRRCLHSAERKPGARAAAEAKRQKRQLRNLRNRRAAA